MIVYYMLMLVVAVFVLVVVGRAARRAFMENEAWQEARRLELVRHLEEVARVARQIAELQQALGAAMAPAIRAMLRFAAALNRRPQA